MAFDQPPRTPPPDRAAERCARQADGLLDEGDRLLLLPHDGRALAWLLFVARGRPGLRLAIPAPALASAGAQRIIALAEGYGLPCALADAPDATVCLAEARAVALDGAASLGAGALAPAEAFRGPLYLLAPDGPDPALAGGDALAGEILAAARISAIATSRGVYRPAMVARFLDDSEAPLDVIPLL